MLLEIDPEFKEIYNKDIRCLFIVHNKVQNRFLTPLISIIV